MTYQQLMDAVRKVQEDAAKKPKPISELLKAAEKVRSDALRKRE